MILFPTPKPHFIAAGIVIAAAIVAGVNLSAWVVRYGWTAALDVDGGGVSTIGAIILLGFGLLLGWPLAAAVYFFAPRSSLAQLVGLSIFCVVGGRLNSTPVVTLEHWVEGGGLALAFAAIALACAMALQSFMRGS
jgi:hypothetical protein